MSERKASRAFTKALPCSDDIVRSGATVLREGQADVTGLDTLHVDLAVVLGKTRMPLGQLLKLGRGAVVALDTGHADPIDILANGHLIARGEVVVRGGAISVQILEMVQKPSVIRDPGARIGGGTAQRAARGRPESGEVPAAA